MPSDTSEKGLEALITDWLREQNRYEQGNTGEFNKEYALDEGRLFRFLLATQPEKVADLHILDEKLEKERFFKQLDKKLRTDGVIEL